MFSTGKTPRSRLKEYESPATPSLSRKTLFLDDNYGKSKENTPFVPSMSNSPVLSHRPLKTPLAYRSSESIHIGKSQPLSTIAISQQAYFYKSNIVSLAPQSPMPNELNDFFDTQGNRNGAP